MDVVQLALPQEPAGGIAGWAADLVDAMGAPGAGLAIALENLFPPLPSEVILPLTGFAAGRGSSAWRPRSSGRRSVRWWAR